MNKYTNEYNKLDNILEGKRILYIPIYSCFDYQTQLLNFKSDGNINRFLTTFFNLEKYKSLDIVCPPQGNDIDWFIDSVNKLPNKTNLIYSEYIRLSAKVQRNISFAKYILSSININDYDIVIAEGQYVVLRLLDYYPQIETIYWCPVCATDTGTRNFLEGNKELDRYIFSRVRTTIFASKGQVEYINQLKYDKNIKYTDYILIETLIDRTIPFFTYQKNETIIKSFNLAINSGFKIVFLPFRLTDEGYRFNEILTYLANIENEKVVVLYTNPNECDIYSLTNNKKELNYIDKHFVKVNKNRDNYYTILDEIDTIIPYFENTYFINHAAIYEFETSNKCKVVRNLEELKSILN